MIRSFLLFLLQVSLLFNLQAQEKGWSSFQWVNEELSGKKIDKTAILVPVKIDNLPNNFLMQLDLGAASTVIRGNTFELLLEKYPSLNSRIDTSKHITTQAGRVVSLNDVKIGIGNCEVINKDIGLIEDYGNHLSVDIINSKSEILIGTIGSDIFSNKVLIIDYPNQQIFIGDSIPSNLNFQNQPFEFVKENTDNRILIPIIFGKERKNIMFDTGASIFPFATSEKNASQICKKEISDSIVVRSWGKSLTMIGKETNVPIIFKGETLLPQTVYFDKSNKFDGFYEENNFFALTGNILFLNNVILIDFENKLFGIKKTAHNKSYM